jgi:hypothetical protein
LLGFERRGPQENRARRKANIATRAFSGRAACEKLALEALDGCPAEPLADTFGEVAPLP